METNDEPKYKRLSRAVVSCAWCGTASTFTPNIPCVACMLQEHTAAPRWALTHRLHPPPDFVPRELIVFHTMSEHILLLPFNLKDSIIKVCEQVQHWFQGFDGSEAYAGSMAGDKMGKTSEKRTKARLQERKDKLFTAISQVTKGSCVYCGQPHSTIESFDTVLPSHFKHSGIDRAAVLTYWTAQHQLGNARLCCKACNSHKGGAERRGIAFYRSLLTGCSTFLKPYANAPFFLPFERDAFTWSHWGEPLPGAGPGRNNKPFTPEDYAAIQQAFLRLALWVVCFSSLSEPEADFLLAYAPEHRQLRFFSESELVPTYYQRISYVRWRKWTKKWQQECACNVLQQR